MEKIKEKEEGNVRRTINKQHPYEIIKKNR